MNPIDYTHIETSISLFDWAERKLITQREVIDTAQPTQRNIQDAQLNVTRTKLTQFKVNDCILITYPKGRMDLNAPTKLDMPLQGPFRVTRCGNMKYEICDLLTCNTQTVHVSCMREYKHINIQTPLDVAERYVHSQ
jgi:hypothetical protein